MTATLERRLSRRRLQLRLDQLLPLELSKETPRLAATPAPIGKYGLWHVKGMQFPPYFQNVRNALIQNGHSVAEASQITWAAIRRWARGQKTGGEKGNIHPEVRAAARAALAGIAKDQARAHAQRAAHEHANIVDQLILREFALSGCALELADPYHASSGKFTSAGNQGSAAPKAANSKTGASAQAGNGPKPISAKQKAAYLKLAAQDTVRAQQLRQEAAKLNLQINALSVLIAQETKFLQTAATGATGAAKGTATGTGTTTKAAATGTTTKAATTGTAKATATGTPRYNAPTTRQALQRNLASLKQITAKRNQLLQEASKLDQQAANYRQLANG